MDRATIFEKGLGIRLLIAVAIAMFAVAAVAGATRQSEAAPAPPPAPPLVLTNVAVGPPAVAEGVGGVATGLQSPNAAPTTRIPSVGGTAAYTSMWTDVPAAILDDVITYTTTLGGLNSLTGPLSVTFQEAAVPGAGFGPPVTVFSQGVAGTATLTVDVAGVKSTATVIIVGGPAAAVFTAPVGVAGFTGTLNPASFPAGTLTGTGAPAQYWFVRVTDATGQRVLTGTPGILTLTDLTGSATITPAFSAVASGGLTLAPVATSEEFFLMAGTAINHGVIAFGLTTSAGSGASGTIEASFASGTVKATKAFVAAGAAASITITEPGPFSGAAASGGVLSPFGVGSNPTSTWLAFVADAAGNGVPGLLPTFSSDTPGKLGSPSPLPAAAPGAAPVGTYLAVITSGATTAPGIYGVTISTLVGVTPVTAKFDVIVGGGASSGTIVSTATEVGINESATITAAFLDVDGNPIPDGSPAPFGIPVLTSLGVITGTTTTEDGALTALFTAGAGSGTATITASVGGVTVQLTIDVGGASGGNPDSVSSTGGTSVEADVGENVPLTVLVEKDGAPFAAAIVRFDATGGQAAPDEVSTGADGLASTNAKFDDGGTFTVTATVLTANIGGILVPVSGLTVVFTVEVTGEVAISLSAGLNIVGWIGGPTSSGELLAENSIVDRIWSVVNGVWVVDSAALPASLRVSITVNFGTGLVVIATTGGTMTGPA